MPEPTVLARRRADIAGAMIRARATARANTLVWCHADAGDVTIAWRIVAGGEQVALAWKGGAVVEADVRTCQSHLPPGLTPVRRDSPRPHVVRLELAAGEPELDLDHARGNTEEEAADAE